MSAQPGREKQCEGPRRKIRLVGGVEVEEGGERKSEE